MTRQYSKPDKRDIFTPLHWIIEDFLCVPETLECKNVHLLRETLRLQFFSMYLLILSDKTDEDDSASATYQAVSELPQANRDTLAYLILHLQKYETKCTILS